MVWVYCIRGLSAFTKEQQLMLKAWLKEGVQAQRAALGVYPFKLVFYLYPRQSNQPVPWAYTRRDQQQNGTLTFTPQQGYERKLKPHLSWYNTSLSPAVMASRLMSQKKYPAAYWGAAWYFVQADASLRQHQQLTLLQVMAQYQLCCRANDSNMQQLQASLRALLKDNTLARLLERFEQQAGRELFPRDFP